MVRASKKTGSEQQIQAKKDRNHAVKKMEKVIRVGVIAGQAVDNRTYR